MPGNNKLLDIMGIRPGQTVCLVGVSPLLRDVLYQQCSLHHVLGRTELDRMQAEGKTFDRVILSHPPGAGEDVEDMLIVRACQLSNPAGGLVFFYCPFPTSIRIFGTKVIKYYPWANVRGADTDLGPMAMTDARGNPEKN